jgi:hypothetical protein
MRNNQTEYLLSVGPLVNYALSKFQSGPARPVLRGIAELGAAFGADVRQCRCPSSRPAESIVKYQVDGNLRISRAISDDSFALVIEYWGCANRVRVGDQRKRGMTCSWDQENSGFPRVRFGGR